MVDNVNKLTMLILCSRHVFHNTCLSNETLLLQKKCYKYWPDKKVETYDSICVRTVEEEILADFTLRTFTIAKVNPFNIFVIVYSVVHEL